MVVEKTSRFHIPKDFINLIKAQALSSENEVYGWLIGYLNMGISHVLAIIECKRFEQQTFISAIPHTQEFQEMTSYMPQGIGPIGIYHSHPASGEVFHSHTDDATLVSLSNQFPQCVSIVTNGTEINYYQMGKNSSTIEISPKFTDSKVPQFLIFSVQEKLKIKIPKSTNKSKESIQKIRIKILNLVNHFFDNIWNHLEIMYKNSKISKDQVVKNYLVNRFNSKPLDMKIPNGIKSKLSSRLVIDKFESQLDTKGSKIKYIKLSLNIDAKILVYVSEENKTFNDLDDLIKTELMNNNILHRIYNSIINIQNKEIFLPQDLYLNFFGFYIRLLSFEDPKMNKKILSDKIFSFFTRFMAFFDIFDKIKPSIDRKKQIREFLKEIDSLSKKFDWYKRIKNKIKRYQSKF
ncbi:MAG: hypothetical protein GF353_05725 [Candidatus Lokiarchaeota archaeon]|nr:hypothetical protein [Candidatus Lokiarchaeota archaeon]